MVDKEFDEFLTRTKKLVKFLSETIEAAQEQSMKYKKLLEGTLEAWENYSSIIKTRTSPMDTEAQIEDVTRIDEEYRREAEKVLQGMKKTDEAIDELLRRAKEIYPD